MLYRPDGTVTLPVVAAAAAAAGASKGGILYHFPTKTALVEALLEDVLDGFEAAVEARSLTGGAGAWARAYVDATFDLEASRPQLAIVLMISSPDLGTDLLRRCSDRLAAWHARLEDAVPAATAAVVRYACDGWWTLASVSGAGYADRATLRAELHRLLDTALRDQPAVHSRREAGRT